MPKARSSPPTRSTASPSIEKILRCRHRISLQDDQPYSLLFSTSNNLPILTHSQAHDVNAEFSLIVGAHNSVVSGFDLMKKRSFLILREVIADGTDIHVFKKICDFLGQDALNALELTWEAQWCAPNDEECVVIQQNLFWLAIQMKLSAVARYILYKAPNSWKINMKNEDVRLLASPLLFAIQNEDFWTAQQIIKQDEEFKVLNQLRDHENNTILHHAVKSADTNLFHQVFDKCSPRLDVVRNVNNETPWDLAIRAKFAFAIDRFELAEN